MKSLFTIVGIVACNLAFSQIPSIAYDDQEEKQTLKISQCSIHINIIGNVATTSYDLVFYNPLPRDLEGELDMPLSEGQEISRYALEINGHLREGVVVEKVKARQAFEAVVRQRIDPGIIHKTKGNAFKTRIYPIPAGGYKRVVLEITETLAGDQQSLKYSLPIDEPLKLNEFSLNVNVIKSSSENLGIISEFENLEFDKRDNVYNLTFNRKNYILSESLRFIIPRFENSDYQLFTSQSDGETYFYLNIKAPMLKSFTKSTPKKIGIYWDNSHSASKRDITKELELLSTYLTSLEGSQSVFFTSFNYKQNARTHYEITNDASELIEHIKQLKNDGATRLENLKIDHGYDEVLLFSDGVNTIGDEMLSTSSIPVYTIASSFGSNYSFLKRLAASGNGEFIDLTRVTIEQALVLMLTDEEKLLSIKYNKSQIREVYPDIATRVNDYVEVVGILEANTSELTINYGYKGKATHSQSYKIDKSTTAPVSRIWAGRKIESLERNYAINQAKILQLGKDHNIVTHNGALLVLDRVEDYVEHDILPPDELKEEYEKLLALKSKVPEISVSEIQELNINRISRLKSWYINPIKVNATRAANIIEVDDEQAVEEIEIDLDVQFSEEMVIEEIVFEEAPEEEAADMIFSITDSGKRISSQNTNNASIKVLAWMPDAPYMNVLRNARGDEIEAKYYQLKEENKNRPSFYVQVSDLFFEKGKKDIALRILSNAIELDLENPEILKLVARRLLDEKEFELAILIYKEISKLRPEEPQSFRDLALAYVENEQYQEALNMFIHILDNDWERFIDIKDIVLNELNCLVSLHGKSLEMNGVNKEYINDMPLDVRISIDWSSNDNDIDLWVIDPNGEKCFYQHAHTKIGGKLSTDFTQGYGPEEFSLKTAKRGIYTVYVNYFSESRQTITGPLTIYATLSTNYGRVNQKSEKIAVQLIENKETRQIGQLEFEL